ncbi:MAG: hypothetical protein WC373_10890 [Smithella sp.]|jgi:hypothetical protein
MIDKYNIGGSTGMNKPAKPAQSECNGLLASDRAICSELIRIAAVLAQCHYMPSDEVDDYHQKTYSASRVAQMMEEAHSVSRDLAVALRNIAENKTIYFYELDGIWQASYKLMNRFAKEGEKIIVGVGCEKEEAIKELKDKFRHR